MADQWKKPCPDCGKNVTWTKAGKPRQHKCEPKEQPQQLPLPTSTGGVTPEEVIAKYIEDRDTIATLKKEFDEKVAAIKDLQAKREAFLRGMMNQHGMEKIGTAAGTVFIDWKDSATVSDREVFLKWVADDWYERKHFLESRVSKAAVKQLQEDGETSPPGVNYTKVQGVKIRRS